MALAKGLATNQIEDIIELKKPCYRLNFEEVEIPDYPYNGIILRKAEVHDYPALMSLDRICFGLSDKQMDNKYTEYCYSSTFIALLNNKIIGKIGIYMDGNLGYIYGFCISPEFRRNGYGREVLSSSLANFLFMQVKTVILEVAIENEKAIQFYKSCGFKELTVYDYYELF